MNEIKTVDDAMTKMAEMKDMIAILHKGFAEIVEFTDEWSVDNKTKEQLTYNIGKINAIADQLCQKADIYLDTLVDVVKVDND